jgi:nanoRNase/pAp phosphatase (c-di-AMP/oligoRNAs hydrolase)
MKVTTAEKISEFFKQFSGADRVLVVISADPDAIASAMAVGRLLRRKVDSVTISCVNAVDRPDNLAMIRLLKVTLVPFAQLPLDTFTKTVLVDSQPSHHELMTRARPQVVIDHHPDTGCRALFTDIRPTYGATATILTEYLRAARIIPSRNLATALYLAIKADTDDFKRQTLIEDVRAFQYLFRRANIPLARRIGQAELRLEYLKYFKTALLHMRLRKGRVFVHLGPVVNPDVCVIIADFFMRIHTVRWSIVSGTCDSKLGHFRNDGSQTRARAKESLGVSARRHRVRPWPGGNQPGRDQGAPIDFKDDHKVAAWIVIRTEKRAGHKTPTPAQFRDHANG